MVERPPAIKSAKREKVPYQKVSLGLPRNIGRKSLTLLMKYSAWSERRSQPQNFLSIGEVLQQGLCEPLMNNRTALKREDAVGQRQNQIEIVFNDNDRNMLTQ